MSLALCGLTFWYGMVIRSWSSFKTLKNLEKNPSSRAVETDLREMLQFWTCFAVIALFDTYMEFFVSWIPLYPLCKLVLLWYIISPATHGSSVIFDNFLAPKFQEKLFWLEKVFLVDILANFIELDWMYEQLTVQLATRLDNVSREQLEILQQKLTNLTDAIHYELERRKYLMTNVNPPAFLEEHADISPPIYEEEDEENDEFEFIQAATSSSSSRADDGLATSRSPSASISSSNARMEVDSRLTNQQQQQSQVLLGRSHSMRDFSTSPTSITGATVTMQRFASARVTSSTVTESSNTPPKATQNDQQARSSFAAFVEEYTRTKSSNTSSPVRYPSLDAVLSSASAEPSSSSSKKQVPNFQPGYYPTRGVQVSPQQQPVVMPLLNVVNNQSFSSANQQHIDVEDVQDETLRSLEMDESSTPERVQSPKRRSDENGDSLLGESSPFEIFSKRFSWMSPRWPSFSSSSRNNNDENDLFHNKDDDNDSEWSPSPSSSTLRKQQHQGEESLQFHVTADDDNAVSGPITRSKARMMGKRLSSRASNESQVVGMEDIAETSMMNSSYASNGGTRIRRRGSKRN